MRHGIKGRRLGRNSAHRKALFRNLSLAIIKNGVIKTTLPKAKEIRPYFEKVVTVAKTDNLVNRRKAISILGSSNPLAIDRLFKSIGVAVSDRSGGYLRIVRCGFRVGDKSPMAIVELVDVAKLVK
jgi:large subunit ribosomal protein L17